jgi:hypothetical protein
VGPASSAVSNRIVKRIRYAVVLALLHLLIGAAPMFDRAEGLWHLIPVLQASEDYEEKAPPSEAYAVGYWPSYEYRVSAVDRVMFAAEFPAAVLVGFDQECLLAVVRPLVYSLMKYRFRVATRIVLIDLLFLGGVLGQWFLVGRSIDLRNQRSMATRWWLVVVAIISGGGIAMVPAVFHGDGLLGHICILAGMMALLAWIALFMTFAVVGIKKTWVVLKAPKQTGR